MWYLITELHLWFNQLLSDIYWVPSRGLSYQTSTVASLCEFQSFEIWQSIFKAALLKFGFQAVTQLDKI